MAAPNRMMMMRILSMTRRSLISTSLKTMEQQQWRIIELLCEEYNDQPPFLWQHEAGESAAASWLMASVVCGFLFCLGGGRIRTHARTMTVVFFCFFQEKYGISYC
jgi:hypothetical protein